MFLVTRAQLVPQAHNEDDNLYDARVDGVQPLTGTACTESGCQGVPPVPPLFATPPSATFEGAGIVEAPPPSPASAAKAKPKPLTRAQKLASALKTCRKKPKKRRPGCEALARKRYGGASGLKVEKSSEGGKQHV